MNSLMVGAGSDMGLWDACHGLGPARQPAFSVADDGQDCVVENGRPVARRRCVFEYEQGARSPRSGLTTGGAAAYAFVAIVTGILCVAN